VGLHRCIEQVFTLLLDLGLTEEQGKHLLDATVEAHRYDDEPEDLREQFSRMSIG